MHIPRPTTPTNPQHQDYTWDNAGLGNVGLLIPPKYSPNNAPNTPPTYICALTVPASPQSRHTVEVNAPPSYDGLFLPSYSELFPRTCLSTTTACCIKSSDAAKMFATCCIESGNTAIDACIPSQETCFNIRQSARECGEILESPHTVSISSSIIGLVLCIENEAIAGGVCLACCCFIESIKFCERNHGPHRI